MGGTSSGQGNIFVNAIYNSIWIQSSDSNLISRNRIFNYGNGYNGIELNYGSSQGNDGKQPPVITLKTVGTGTATVSGTSLSGDTIELFKSNSANPGAYQFIGSTATNSSGNWVVGSLTLHDTDIVVATARDAKKNTSEFSCLMPLSVSANITINFGITTQLSAWGANQVSYSWLPTSSLSNAAISNPTASPLASTTFTVTENAFTECSATKNITIDVIQRSRFVVSDTIDNDSTGSLRWAMHQANRHPGADTIAFNITGRAPHTIVLDSALPSLTGQVLIDGTTQPANGYGGISPKIVVDGNSLNVTGFDFEAGSAHSIIQGLFIRDFQQDGVYIYTDSITVMNNIISNNSTAGVEVEYGSNFIIQGNKIGTDTSGQVSLTNYYGITVEYTNRGLIGGSGTNQGNLISGNTNPISVYASNAIFIKGNKIGTDISGTTELGNYYGLAVAASDSIFVGGSQTNEGNLFAANYWEGIDVYGMKKCIIQGNKFGTDITGTLPIGDRSAQLECIILEYGTDSCIIGGSMPGEGNLISNSEEGIEMYQSSYNQVFGNKFGTDTSATSNIGNWYDLNIYGGSDHNYVGGTLAGEGNILENAVYNSIYIQTSDSDLISQNQIFNYGNGYNGIELNYGSGPGNNGKQPAVITSVVPGSGTGSASGVSNPGDVIEVFLSDSTGLNAFQYLGTVTTDGTGNWILNNQDLSDSNYVTSTATDAGNNTSEFSNPYLQTGTAYTNAIAMPPGILSVVNNNSFTTNNKWFSFIADSTSARVTTTNSEFFTSGEMSLSAYALVSGSLVLLSSTTLTATAADDDNPSDLQMTLNLSSLTYGQVYYIYVARTSFVLSSLSFNIMLFQSLSGVNPVLPPIPCYDCVSSFFPQPGKKYLVSAWVKEAGAAITKTSYTNPEIIVSVNATTTLGIYLASGEIIDGWQRIEGTFVMPQNSTSIGIQLKSLSGNCYFDDVRVFPFDASMKSYVYDPVTLRLVAELDERNYATRYEYDEEGKPIRVKKETERGIMTIKESRNSTVKKNK